MLCLIHIKRFQFLLALCVIVTALHTYKPKAFKGEARSLRERYADELNEDKIQSKHTGHQQKKRIFSDYIK